MTLDTYVGFREEPKDLEAFLVEQGYTATKKTKGVAIQFEHKDIFWINLFYSPHAIPAEDEDECPNWEKSGFRIVSDVNINYPLGIEYTDEAERLSKELAKRFNGVLYDAALDSYFAAESL